MCKKSFADYGGGEAAAVPECGGSVGHAPFTELPLCFDMPKLIIDSTRCKDLNVSI